MKVIALIPARLNSKRLKKKVLLPLNNLPLIIHVYKRAQKARRIDDVVICCDDLSIYKVAKKYGAKCILTSKLHRNGTERIYEAYKKLKKKFDLVIDVQGDEPLINPQHIDKVVEYHHKNKKADIVVPNLKIKEKNNPNIVKIFSNNKNEIIYFSRLDVPFGLKKRIKYLKKHLSIVSFKPRALKKFCKYKQSVNEKIENIELFRALDLGMNLKTFRLNGDSFSIDVKSDYKKAIRYVKKDKITKTYS